MNGKKAKRLRRRVAGDPDMDGRLFARQKVIACDIITHQDIVDPKSLRTFLNHPDSYRAQYKQAKKGRSTHGSYGGFRSNSGGGGNHGVRPLQDTLTLEG